MSCGTSLAQYDVLLLGAITVLGASMGKHVRCSYGGKMMSPCLQTFVVALPASGKGVLSLVRLLAEPIHDEIREQVDESMACYRREKAKYDTLGKERGKTETPVTPLNKMFLISGNNTGTGILQNLMDSDGTGLICESEAEHHLHRHRFGIRTLERHHAQSLRPTTACPTTGAPTTNTER